MSMLGTIASLPQNALHLINSHTKPRLGANLVAGTSGAKAAATSGTTSTSTTSTSTAAQATTDIGSTFLSLLTKELQNQDPSAPMDSTAMVGQMISLNQLDQLIAINSALTPAAATTTTPVTPVTGKVAGSGLQADSASTLAAKQALLSSTLPSTSSPFNANATLNAAAQSASNAGTLNLTSFNSMFGGK